MKHHSKRYPIVKIKARAWIAKQPVIFTVTGQTAKALQALVKAKEHGITALEVSSWAYRLGAYIHILRHEFNLDIRTDKEEHPNGWHARYVLLTPVDIVEVTTTP
jgi:hypothetical protein